MSLTSPPVLASSPAVEYTQRMNRVLGHIDRHLDTPLELATLADATHISVFHFHRMLATWMGESLGDYVRRRRLEVAAVPGGLCAYHGAVSINKSPSTSSGPRPLCHGRRPKV